MKIIGLDACKLSVVACVLCHARPSEPRQFYYEAKFQTFQADAAGINALLALNPDVVVIEPTGVNYTKLWVTHLARNGVEVRLVGHKQLHHYRETVLQLPDKDDEADALALACYWFDYHQDSTRWVQIRDRTIVRIRELVLRLAHLNRVQSPIINRLRQDLVWQFPEVARTRSPRLGDRVPLLWGWLAGQRKSKRYDRLYSDSIGLGLTDTVRLHAFRLCDLQREEMTIERELKQLIQDSRFVPYRKVFAAFGFGQRVEAILLSQIYPIENYLKDGKPIIKISRARFSKKNKTSKKHLSRRRFEKGLGTAPAEKSSGDKKGNKTWQWLFTRIEPVKINKRPANPIAFAIGQKLDREKSIKMPIRLARMRTISYAVRKLFYELVQSVK
jgi:Transposase